MHWPVFCNQFIFLQWQPCPSPLTCWRVASSKGRDANPWVWHVHKTHASSRTPSLTEVQERWPLADATQENLTTSYFPEVLFLLFQEIWKFTQNGQRATPKQEGSCEWFWSYISLCGQVGENALNKRGRLTNEQGKTARQRGPPRQSGLGCSANSSSAGVKDIRSHLCPHTKTLSSLSLSRYVPGLCLNHVSEQVPHEAGQGPTWRSLTLQTGKGAPPAPVSYSWT